MPLTFRIPVQVDLRGRLAITSDPVTIIEQRITDMLVSYRGEREMRPMHGCDLQGLLFSPIRSDVLGLKAQETKNLLQARMTFGQIVNVTMEEVYGEASTIRVKVWYRILPGETPRVVEKTITGLVTEETVL